MTEALNSAAPASQQPPGATGAQEGPDGKMYYHDAAGKQLSLAPDNMQKDLDPNASVSGVPEGLTGTPITGVPEGLTGTPIPPKTQSQGIQGVPEGLVGTPIEKPVDQNDPQRGAAEATGLSPGKTSLWQRFRDFVQYGAPNGSFLAHDSSKVLAPGPEKDMQLMSPEALMTAGEQEKHPMLDETGKFFGQLTTPQNVMMALGLGGAGKLPGLARPVVGLLTSIGFGAPVIQQATEELPEFKDAMLGKGKYADMPDEDRAHAAERILTRTVWGAAMLHELGKNAHAEGKHLGGGDEVHLDQNGNPVPKPRIYGPEQQPPQEPLADRIVKGAAKKVVGAVGDAADATADAIWKSPEALGEAIGRSNDPVKTIARASQIAPKKYKEHVKKIGNVIQDLQAVLNKHGDDITGPADFADKINEHIHDQEDALQAIAGATKGDPEPVVPQFKSRARAALDKFFDDAPQRYGTDSEVRRAKQDLMNRIMVEYRNPATGEIEHVEPNLLEAEGNRRGLSPDINFDKNAKPITRAYAAGAKEITGFLRNVIDESYENKNVGKVKEWRAKERDLIDVKKGLYDAQAKADKMGSGSIWKAMVNKIGATSTAIAWSLFSPAVLPIVAGEKIRQNFTNPNVNIQRAIDISDPNAKATVPTIEPGPNDLGNQPPPTPPGPGPTPPPAPVPTPAPTQAQTDFQQNNPGSNVTTSPESHMPTGEVQTGPAPHGFSMQDGVLRAAPNPVATPAGWTYEPADKYRPSEKATTMSGPTRDLGREWNAGEATHELDRNNQILKNKDATPEEKQAATSRIAENREIALEIAAKLQQSLKDGVDHQTNAELASHYNEIVGATPPAELEQRFLGDLETKVTENKPLTPEEKQLLQKVNASKARQAATAQQTTEKAVEEFKKNAEKSFQDAQKINEKDQQDREAAAEKANAEAAAALEKAEAEKKEKEEQGLQPNETPPFETEPHLKLPGKWEDRGITGAHVTAHELGHQLMTTEHGYPVEDILSHNHPRLPEGALAASRWDSSSFANKEGKIDLGIMKNKIGDFLDILHGGPVAQEIASGIPMDATYGKAGDLKTAKHWLKQTGFSAVEAAQLMKASELRAREALTHPGVPEIIKRYTTDRQKGLDENYLMSPEALGAAVQEFKNARGGTNAKTDNESPNTGKDATSDGKSDTGGASGVSGGSKKGPRPAGKTRAGIGKGRRAEGVTDTKLETAKDNIAEKMAKLKENLDPEFHPGVKEVSTGEPAEDAAIKEGGGIPGGFLDMEGYGRVKMFYEPEHGITLGFKPNEAITASAVKAKIAKGREDFGHPPANDVQGELSKTREQARADRHAQTLRGVADEAQRIFEAPPKENLNPEFRDELAAPQQTETSQTKAAITNPAKPDEFKDWESTGPTADGMVEKGNIDLSKRPLVHRKDGTISTLYSMSISTPKGEVLIPRVSPDGKILSIADAKTLFHKTHQHLGIFKDVESADKFADLLHHKQIAFQTQRNNGKYNPTMETNE